MGRGLVALLLVIGLLGGWASPAAAQQPVPQTPELESPDQRLQQVAEQLRERGHDEAARKLLRNRPGARTTAPQRKAGPLAKTVSGDYTVFSPKAVVKPNEKPFQRLHPDLDGAPIFAGDVDGDGTNDFLYAETGVRDGRTEALEDVTGRTALFFGGSDLSATDDDQLLYERLRPAGDLDDDGKDDALTISGNTVRVDTGSTTGYQDTGTEFSAQLPGSATRGFTDLDGDGYEDVLIWNDDDRQTTFNQIAVVYGAQDVSQISAQSYVPAGDSSESYFEYETANLDGSGPAEIVRLRGDTTNATLISMEIWSVNSSRELTLEQSFDVDELVGTAADYRISAVDVNGDGQLEITVNGNDAHYWFQASSALSYDSTPIDAGVNFATPVGDLDGDGNHDFYTFEEASTEGGAGTRYVSFGPDDLTNGLSFDTQISYASDPDVTGSAGFVPSGGYGDLNGDGTDDTVLSYFDQREPPYETGRRFVLGQGDRTIQTTTVKYPLRYFADRALSTSNVGDVNGDGIDDAAVVFFDRGTVGIYYGGGSFGDQPDRTLKVGRIPYLAVGGDFDGNGTNDVAVTSFVDNHIDVFLGEGGLSQTPEHTISLADQVPSQFQNNSGFYYLANAGDLNDDGIEDFVASAPFTTNDAGENLNQVFVYYGDSSLPTTADAVIDYGVGTPLNAGYKLAGLGDFNDDGVDDLAVGVRGRENDNGSTGAVDVFYGADGGADFSAGADLSITPPEQNVSNFSFAMNGGEDVNGDGYPDLVVGPFFWFDQDDTAAYVYYGGSGQGLGDATFDEGYKAPVDALGPNAAGTDFTGTGFVNQNLGQLTVEDFNRDGAAEVVMNTGFGVNTNALFYPGGTVAADANSGTHREPVGVFEAPNTTASLGGAWRVATGDFTDNGRVDYFAKQRDGNEAGGSFAKSGRIYRYTVSLEAPLASATRGVFQNGETRFGDTGLTIDFRGISGEDSTTVEKKFDPVPSNASGLDGSSVTDRYTIASGSGLEIGSGTTVQFDAGALNAQSPGNLIVYQRPTPGQGVFTGLETTYDSETGTLSAPIESFGEFALAPTPDSVTVWAGDTDNDGTVDQADVLPLGTYWDQSGPARDETGCDWTGDKAAPWTPEAATYADANGDGTVNQDDVLCLGLNWGQTRSTSSSAVLAGKSGGDEPAGALALRRAEQSGSTVWVELYVREMASLMGVATELTFDPEVVSVESVEPGARMGEAPLLQSNTDEQTGTLGLGVSRKGTATSKAAGKAPVARIKLRSTVEDPEVSLREGQATTAEGRAVSLATDGGLNALPEEVTLEAPAPNPVRRQATLRYALPEAQQVRLTVYDVLGRKVAVLVDEKQQAGEKQVRVDASQLSSGTYFYRLDAGEVTKTERLTIVR